MWRLAPVLTGVSIGILRAIVELNRVLIITYKHNAVSLSLSTITMPRLPSLRGARWPRVTLSKVRAGEAGEGIVDAVPDCAPGAERISGT